MAETFYTSTDAIKSNKYSIQLTQYSSLLVVEGSCFFLFYG